MHQRMDEISRLNREAARFEVIAAERFSQASAPTEFEGDLIDMGMAYTLAGDLLRLKAAKLLLDVPPVVLGNAE